MGHVVADCGGKISRGGEVTRNYGSDRNEH